MTKEQKAQIARENGAKSKGPVSIEGKSRSRRNAIAHGRRAQALKLMVPPHSACLANEDRQAFYSLLDSLITTYHPHGETELQIVRDIADMQWKLSRNKQIESAIYNRELIRQAALVTGSLPELRDLEIAVAAQEALTGNKTLAELRKDSQLSLRSIAQLQRRLLELQRHWAAPEPPPAPERTDTQPASPALNVSGPLTPLVSSLYRQECGRPALELVGRPSRPNTGTA